MEKHGEELANVEACIYQLKLSNWTKFEACKTAYTNFKGKLGNNTNSAPK